MEGEFRSIYGQLVLGTLQMALVRKYKGVPYSLLARM